MILSFSTKDKNGHPSNFISKIWQSIIDEPSIEITIPKMPDNYVKQRSCIRQFYEDAYCERFGSVWSGFGRITPKRHTIRKDAHNRWHAGVLIHFIVFPRSSRMFQFAPVIPCVSTQKIKIVHDRPYDDYKVFVDDLELNIHEVQQLALNDGFENIIAFLLWFRNGFEGKIIHWTDLRY